MFDRQMALVKGQGYNLVQSLSHPDEGNWDAIFCPTTLTFY